MKKGLTEIVCVLDRSGSMAPFQVETITKFNNFVEEQKKVPGEALVTVVLFDDNFETLRSGIPIKDLPALSNKEYYARGWTCLNDAVGKTINEVGGRLNAMAEADRPEKVIFVVITDGQENSSKEFPGEDGRKRVRAMVEHQREKYAWEFLFLGANMDAVQVGGLYGVHLNMCANFANTNQGVSSAYAASGQRVARMRCMASQDYAKMDNLDDRVKEKEKEA
jgi:uncharacterized protein YegL